MAESQRSKYDEIQHDDDQVVLAYQIDSPSDALPDEHEEHKEG